MTTTRRTFSPGSEWTYLKLYTGPASADSLLREAIGPVARELIALGATDQWFFMRYSDPRSHLRVRFHGDPGALREPIQELAARALESGVAHDAQLGTYRREIERYGGPEGILIAERLFHADSDTVLTLLDMFEPGERGHIERWQIGALGSNALMRDFGLDTHARTTLAENMHKALERRLRADTTLRKAVARRVRDQRSTVEELLAATVDGTHPLTPGIAAVAHRSTHLRPLVAELEALRATQRLDRPLDALASVYVHMWLNRLCRSHSNFQQYVTFTLLAAALRAGSSRVSS